MSNEIKVGDKVRVRKDAPRIYTDGWRFDWRNLESIVSIIENEDAVISPDDSGEEELTIPLKYLVKADAEAKEAKFKVGDRVEELISRRSGIVLGIEGDIVVVGIPYDKEKQYWHIDSVELVKPTEQTETEKKPNIGSIKIPVKADLTDSYWDTYAADLAKEVVLKAANKFNDPKEAAEYAVKVAKAVVDGLKRK